MDGKRKYIRYYIRYNKKSNMISFIELGNKGRLGNQMFQFSAGYSLSKKNNTEFKFPIENMVKNGYNGIDLYNCFELSSSYLEHFNTIIQSIEYSYTEDLKDLRFNPSFFTIPDKTNISGYFNSEKFFIDYKEEILRELKFKEEILDKSNNIIKDYNLQEENIVGIHVRRSDYMELDEWVGEDYYRKSIDTIKSYISSPRFFIFSDDINWCKGFKEFNPSICLELDKYCSLCIMSKLKNLIISNSTFSWWGAYMQKDRNITIIPGKWLKNNTYDVWKEDWIKI